MALPDFLPSVGASFRCDRRGGSNDKEARTYLCKQTLGNKETEEEWDNWQPEPTMGFLCMCRAWSKCQLWEVRRVIFQYFSLKPSALSV